MSLKDNPRLQKIGGNGFVGHERTIIMGLIVSDKFCTKVAGQLDSKMFKTTWIRALVVGCVDYFNKYGHSIKGNVQTLFATLQDTLSETEAELLSVCLELMADEYVDIEASFNEEYHVDKAKEFIAKFAAEALAVTIQSYILQGSVDKATDAILSYRTSAVATDNAPRDARDLDNYGYFKNPDGEADARVVLEYPGAVGQLIGALRRAWLVAFLAPMKRGKSNFLMESAILGVSQGHNVFVALHEMQEDEWFDRLLANMAGTVIQKDGVSLTPMFDCIMNRDGTCNHPGRRVREPYQKGQNARYAPCLLCEGTQNATYKPCIVNVPVDMRKMTRSDAQRELNRKLARHTIKVKKYPASTATSKMIYNDWRSLAEDGTVCDIIASDYADIQGLEDKNCRDKIQAINDTWLGLKWLGDATKALILTATQGKLKSLTSEDIEQDDVAGYIGKAAHVDAMIGLSQTKEEKAIGIMRLSNLYHRFASCNDGTTCTVLQRLVHGKYMLDSRLGKFM